MNNNPAHIFVIFESNIHVLNIIHITMSFVHIFWRLFLTLCRSMALVSANSKSIAAQCLGLFSI